MRPLTPPAPVPLIALALALVAAAAPVAASTAEEFLNAPVWYLEYEVSFTSAHQGTYQNGSGEPLTFTSNMQRVFSAREALNLRSGGPGSITMMSLSRTADGSQPTAADAQRISTEMMALMDHTANWLVGGPGMDENATDADIAAASEPASPARIAYLRVDTGKNLTDEMGGKFDWTSTTTANGEGLVLAGGFGVTMLEMDTAKKTYMLALPYGFNAMLARATQETVDITTPKGAAPYETRQTEDMPIDRYPYDLKLAEPQDGSMAGGMLIRGVLDPATGKISGEQSFSVTHTERNEAVPGTLVFKYTLSMTRPKQ